MRTAIWELRTRRAAMNENEIIVKYEINQYSYHEPCYEIIFDKAANAFGKSVEIEKRVIEKTN